MRAKKLRETKPARGREPDRAGRPSGSWALTPEIEAELAGVAAGSGCELLHAEWKGGVLRLVLDRPAAPPAPLAPLAPQAPLAREAGPSEVSGVSLADCEHVAKQASALLDVLDFGNGRYLLEVSSPGLDRQLYRPGDYQRFLGRLARVTFEAASGRRTVVARLAELHPGAVTLADDRTGERLTLPLETIRLARLEVEL